MCVWVHHFFLNYSSVSCSKRFYHEKGSGVALMSPKFVYFPLNHKFNLEYSKASITPTKKVKSQRIRKKQSTCFYQTRSMCACVCVCASSRQLKQMTWKSPIGPRDPVKWANQHPENSTQPPQNENDPLVNRFH